MHHPHQSLIRQLGAAAWLIICCTGVVWAQTTAFTYQGKLTDAGNPANANYDLQFKLFDTVTVGTGTQQGATVTISNVAVTAGVFTVQLDFGAGVFPGAARFLEIGIKPISGGVFTVLGPRQPITSTPYAIQTLNAQQLGGLPASGFVQNSATQQAGANLNIGGNGTVGGTLTAGTLSGNGASLTNLSAANINSGTLSNARLGVVPLANGGTGLSTGPTAAGQFLRSSGAGVWAVGGIQASDLPALAYVAKAGDTMTGTINLPANGLLVADNQLALVGGNVGIGTVPDAANKLEVNGRVVVKPGGSGGDLYLSAPSGETGIGIIGTDRADIRFDGSTLKLLAGFGAGAPPSTNGIVITREGNVGIGTTTPVNYKLRVDTINNPAIYGSSTSNIGVSGTSDSSSGVVGFSSSGNGVVGYSSSGYAGYFLGKVHVTGVIEKAGGGFKIDHPLDPENKYLVHSFVESPDMKNLYDGTVTTDANGEVEITLPDWFATLNRDFRYQLTCLGVFAQAIIAEKIKDNRFKIKTSLPNVEVSWQVTGTRQDAWAKQNRLPVEEPKPKVERGSYQNPSAFGQPEEKGIEWARNPAQMKQHKEERERWQREQDNKTAAPITRPNNR